MNLLFHVLRLKKTWLNNWGSLNLNAYFASNWPLIEEQQSYRLLFRLRFDILQRIRKHFDHVIDASAFLLIDKAKEKDLRQTAEITIHLKGKELFAEAHHEDLYHAMDAVVEKLERQVVKHKEKIQSHHHEKHFE